MYTAAEILVGLTFCFILIVLARGITRYELRIYAAALSIAALIYVCFAYRGASAGWVALVLLAVLVFTALAWLGLRITPWILVFGWVLHGAWDMVLHTLVGVAFVPDWYPIVCVTFDLFLAGYIAVRLRKGPFPGSEQGATW